MVKKKTTVKDGIKHENLKEQTDNDDGSTMKNHHEKARKDQADQSCAEEDKVTETVTGAAPPDKVVTPEKSPEEKLAEMQDKYLRLSAEFDNYRKRTLREKIDLTKYAGENILLDILPLMDDFERAIYHMTDAADCTSIKDGINLIYGKFFEFLKQNGVREIESLNCAFNVDLHDAVAKVPVEEEEKKGKIVDVIQKGYYLQDKVIRHSKVAVGE